jgi:hypothetical protein
MERLRIPRMVALSLSFSALLHMREDCRGCHADYGGSHCDNITFIMHKTRNDHETKSLTWNFLLSSAFKTITPAPTTTVARDRSGTMNSPTDFPMLFRQQQSRTRIQHSNSQSKTSTSKQELSKWLSLVLYSSEQGIHSRHSANGFLVVVGNLGHSSTEWKIMYSLLRQRLRSILGISTTSWRRVNMSTFINSQTLCISWRYSLGFGELLHSLFPSHVTFCTAVFPQVQYHGMMEKFSASKKRAGSHYSVSEFANDGSPLERTVKNHNYLRCFSLLKQGVRILTKLSRLQSDS